MEAMEPTAAQAFSLHDFEVISPLGSPYTGSGQFGRVLLVRQIPDCALLALKVLRKAALINVKQLEHAKNECEVLARISHPFIVKL